MAVATRVPLWSRPLLLQAVCHVMSAEAQVIIQSVELMVYLFGTRMAVGLGGLAASPRAKGQIVSRAKTLLGSLIALEA